MIDNQFYDRTAHIFIYQSNVRNVKYFKYPFHCSLLYHDNYNNNSRILVNKNFNLSII